MSAKNSEWNQFLSALEKSCLDTVMLWGATALLPFGIDVTGGKYEIVTVASKADCVQPHHLNVIFDTDLICSVDQVVMSRPDIPLSVLIPAPYELLKHVTDQPTRAHIHALLRACKRI